MGEQVLHSTFDFQRIWNDFPFFTSTSCRYGDIGEALPLAGTAAAFHGSRLFAQHFPLPASTAAWPCHA
jgi:hypothetical protein